jgi:ribosome-associated toxin RatA of RatAB toxin-antitoxin module
MASHDCRPYDPSFLDEAPEHHVQSVELGCSPERLVEIFEDPASWPRWVPGIQKVEWTRPGPHGVGSTRTVTFRGGAQIVEHFDVWSSGQISFHVQRVSEPIFHAFAERYDIVPLPDGRCRLTWTVAYEPRDRFAKLHPWVRPAMRLALRGFTLLLRRLVAKEERAPLAVPG